MSTLLKDISNSDTIIMFSEVASFPLVSGVVLIGTEQIAYDSNYNGTLYGCVRGYNSTSAASHTAGDAVSLFGYYHALAGEAGSFTSVTVSGLTASTALTADASKVLASSSTTSTELSYVHGVTSAIQTQLNTKAPTASPIFTASFTLPVITTTQRDALTATKGMLVYNSTTDLLNYYDGAWKVVATV